MTLTTVAIGGFSSEVGKTTLVCDLLRAFPGWEAIKVTRGHYRSCGKDPQACCVSHLLSDEPLVRSGRSQTYEQGKDTGRYWDAGASNVHWVIVTDAQVERGIRLALERVRARGVLIEGNSFLKYVRVDFALLVARSDGGQIKPSARHALAVADALYLSEFPSGGKCAGETERTRAGPAGAAFPGGLPAGLPVFTREDLPRLVAQIGESDRALSARVKIPETRTL